MQFSTRKMLLGLSFICTIFVIFVAIEEYRKNFGIVDPVGWPPKLTKILDDNELSRESVKVRRGRDFLFSLIWRMPASDSLIQDHIDSFGLKHVSNNGIEIRQVLESLPYGWSFPENKDLSCFASPVGVSVGNVPDGGELVILVHDHNESELFCLHYNNF